MSSFPTILSGKPVKVYVLLRLFLGNAINGSLVGVEKNKSVDTPDAIEDESLGGSEAVAKASNAGETTKESRRLFESSPCNLCKYT